MTRRARRRSRSRGTPASLARRLAALALGSLATFLLLELTLAAAYKGFVWQQQRDNLQSLAKDGGDVRILAVGESTTGVAGDGTGAMLVPQTAWPYQLEDILEERDPSRRYTVWNNGIMGGTSSESLQLLESTLPAFRPHIIVVMMGIKDTPDELMPYFHDLPHWLRASRTVQLISWLVDDRALRVNAHVTDIRTPADLPPSTRKRLSHNGMTIKEVGIAAGSESLAQAQVAVYLWCIGRVSQAEAIAAELVAQHDKGHNLLAFIQHSSGRRAEAVAMLEAVAERRSVEPMHWVVLAELHIRDRNFEAAESALGRARDGVAQLAPGSAATISRQMVVLTEAELRLVQEQWDAATALVESLAPMEMLTPNSALARVFPPPDLLAHAALGRAALGKRDWIAAERHLLDAIERDSRKQVNLFLLSQVYRATGQTDKEAQLRRKLLLTSGRMAEYFELAKLFRLTGHPEEADRIVAQAVKDIPSLKQNMRTLYEIAERDGIKLVVMQYPGFSVDALQAYAPAADYVDFIDNEHIFDADPDRYFFEPTYPNSFSHYTEEGAVLMADHIADTVLEVVAR